MENYSNTMENSTATVMIKAEDKNLQDLQGSVLQAKNLFVEFLSEAAETDSTKKFPAKSFQNIAKAGLLIAPLPQKLGGFGLGLENGTTYELLKILKHFGRGNLVVGRVFEGHYNALLLLRLYGSDEQNKRYAADVKNNKIFGVWNTEAADGVKIEPLKNGKFRLSGAKTFATGVDFVERPFVNAALPNGDWQMCIVPMEKVATKVDASWWNPMGMKSTRSFRVDFTGVEISQDDLIGQPGDYYRQPYFSGGAIRFAAVQLGAAETLFDETRKYLRDLHRTKDLFQQTRLGEMAVLIESGNLWLAGASKKFEEYTNNPTQESSENFLAYANLMRTAIEQLCQELINLCVKCVGARGLNKPYHFERIIRDLTIYLRQPAPDASLAAAGSYVLESETPSDDLWEI